MKLNASVNYVLSMIFNEYLNHLPTEHMFWAHAMAVKIAHI